MFDTGDPACELMPSHPPPTPVLTRWPQHILSNLLSSHAIFQNDGGDWYLNFEQDPEWVYTLLPNQQDWTKTAFC
jgi:hypothetical protein